MYFDDVSRYSVPWEPDGNDSGLSLKKQKELQERAIQDKVKAMKRMLGGYDFESAIELTTDRGMRE